MRGFATRAAKRAWEKEGGSFFSRLRRITEEDINSAVRNAETLHGPGPWSQLNTKAQFLLTVGASLNLSIPSLVLKDLKDSRRVRDFLRSERKSVLDSSKTIALPSNVRFE